MNTTANPRLRIMVEAGVMLAAATVLSFLHLPSLPYGGNITFCASLPILLFAYRHGLKWGFLCSFANSLLQILLGMGEIKGITGLAVVGSVLFDYLLADTVIGLGGVFRRRIKNPSASLACGALLALFLKYVSHFISGFIFFGEYAEWFFTQDSIADWGAKVLDTFTGPALYAVYSAIYNATYMLPEMVITAVVAAVIAAIPVLVKKDEI